MLTSKEQLRYSRQVMLKDIGEQGQLALNNATVLVVGVGGLGCPVSLYLAAAGIGKLLLCDGDQVELTNLQRQVLFTEQSIGTNKAEAAAEHLAKLNPLIEIEAVDDMLDDELAAYYISQADIVVDCTDNIATRYLLNQHCLSHQTPLIIGAATGFDGQLFFSRNQANHACYQCVFPKTDDAPVDNCQTLGILGPVLSIIGGMQALMAIKYLAGLSNPENQLMMFDGMSQRWQHFNVNKQQHCLSCG